MSRGDGYNVGISDVPLGSLASTGIVDLTDPFAGESGLGGVCLT